MMRHDCRSFYWHILQVLGYKKEVYFVTFCFKNIVLIGRSHAKGKGRAFTQDFAAFRSMHIRTTVVKNERTKEAGGH